MDFCNRSQLRNSARGFVCFSHLANDTRHSRQQPSPFSEMCKRERLWEEQLISLKKEDGAQEQAGQQRAKVDFRKQFAPRHRCSLDTAT